MLCDCFVDNGVLMCSFECDVYCAGSMFPSHATMYWGAVSFEDDRESRIDEYQRSMQEWNQFNKDMKRCYNLDMNILNETYEKEQSEYFIYSSLWMELRRYVLLPTSLSSANTVVCVR